MTSQSLYRKWRSRTFAEVVGQDHITSTLTHALRADRLGHAYLFCGPRGTGKTSTARLLAKAANCLQRDGGEPCNHCEMCAAFQQSRAIDLVEIDAASNRGIDEIRDLREKVNFAPTQARYRFYILDEAHMLSNDAFNALLKTLEEPPPHAVFVLVTTEPHKIPATIISRCQRFDFRRIAVKDLLGKLHRICKEEGLAIEPAALELVARNATGSFRDAESLLDQLAAYGGEHITLAYVQRLLGTLPTHFVVDLVQHMLRRESGSGLKLINSVADEGADLRQFNRELLAHLHGLLLLKTVNSELLNVTVEMHVVMQQQAEAFDLHELLRALRLFAQADQALRATGHPQLPLELAFLEFVTPKPAATPAQAGLPAPVRVVEAAPAPSVYRAPVSSPLSPRTAAGPSQPAWTSADRPTTRAPDPVIAPKGNGASRPASEAPDTASEHSEDPGATPGPTLEQVKARWPKILEGVRAESNSVAGLLRDSEPTGVENGTLILGFYYSFHKENVESAKNRAVVERVLGRVLGCPCRLRCVLAPRGKGEGTAPKAPLSQRERIEAAAKDPQVRAALEAFPGAEIAEVVD